VIIDGNDPGIDGVNNPDGPNGASSEAYLDVELAGAVAPAATVDLIIAGDTALENGLGLAAEHAVYGDVAPVLSISFGSCEAGGGSGFWNTLWEQAAAQGQTVMVSTGDAGSAGCDDDNTQEFAVYGQQVNGIASTPWNVAVGGTDFYYSSYNGTQNAQSTQLEQYWGNPTKNASDLTPTVTLQSKIPEQPWNDSQFGLNLFSLYLNGDGTSIAGGGGGASNCATGTYPSSCVGYPKPAWQTGTGVPADKVRDLPDVSLFAANGLNYTYYPICASDGDCQPVSSGEVQISGIGGTSASTPAFAGIMALVNQKYGPQGQADFVLYPLAQQYPSAFNDVTVGTNSVPCNLQTVYYLYNGQQYYSTPDDCIAATPAYTETDSTYGQSLEGQIGNTTTKVAEYNAGVGYDLATGLGTIDANNLVTNWANVKLTSSSVTLGSSKTTFTHGTAVTISGAVTPGAATGLVSLETTASEPLQNAETTFTVGANGAYTGSIAYLPGGTYDIYGSYSGDGIYAPSTSAKTSITVTPENSTTTLQVLNSASLNPNTGTVTAAIPNGASVPYGTQLLLEAEPAPAASNSSDSVPTGSVTFLNGTSTIGTSTINATGQAEFNDAPLVSTTPYSVTAKYSGDASYNTSTSAATTFTVVKDTPSYSYLTGTGTGGTPSGASGTTTVTLVLSNTANINLQSLGYIAYSPFLAPTGVITMTGLPSGALSFPALQSTLDPNYDVPEGTTTVGLPSGISPGTYTVTFTYPGDNNYNGFTGTGSLVITAPAGTASTTTVTASPTATSTAQLVTFNVTVTGATGKGAPTGSIELQFGGYYQGPFALTAATATTSTATVVVNSNGLLVGQNIITAQYFGDTTYAPSYGTVIVTNGSTANYTLSNSGPIAVAQGSSGTSTITLTPTGGFTGSVALSCVVTPAAAVSTPTCSLPASASITGTTAASATLTLNTTATTSTGNYVVTVTGTSGSLTFTTSVPVVVTVPAPPPAIALSNSGPVTLASGGATGTPTITVTPSGGFTGAVTLSCAVTGTGAISPTCTVASPVTISGTTAGTATLTVTSTSSTTAGTYTVTVTGTGTGVTASTTAVSVTVQAVTQTPTVTLSNSGSITIASPGGSGTSTVTVTPGGGFTGSVSLTCSVSSTASEAPTCLVATPVTISGTTAGMATLTVNTTAASAALEVPRMRMLPIGGGIAAATLLFFLVPMKRRRISTLLGALVLIAVVGFSTGCGGGGSAPSGNPGTPAGTYSVTVSGTATGVTITPITVSVTVQ
jgi:hypothetical protein